MITLTFNVRCEWDDYDGINSFIHRGTMIYEKIKKEKPDIIAFQEVTPEILQYFKTICPEYNFFGTFRDENFCEEGLFIAVRKDKFGLIFLDTFWLSNTPYVPASRFDCQSIYPRVAVVCEIRELHSNNQYRIVNIHLDHISDEAKILGLKCALKKIQEYESIKPMSTVLLGDFNSDKNSSTIEYCSSNPYINLFDITAEIKCTFHNFGKTNTYKIDYIFVSEDIKQHIDSVKIWDDSANGIYLSDHFPIEAVIN